MHSRASDDLLSRRNSDRPSLPLALSSPISVDDSNQRLVTRLPLLATDSCASKNFPEAPQPPLERDMRRVYGAGPKPRFKQTRNAYDPHMPLTNGATFAGFKIVRLLGSDGMGEV